MPQEMAMDAEGYSKARGLQAIAASARSEDQKPAQENERAGPRNFRRVDDETRSTQPF
jgi:hypothetical protein